MKTALISLVVLLAIGTALSVDTNPKRTLVLLDHPSIKTTHSQFFKSLKDRGFNLTFKAADDSSLALSEYGSYLYDQLVIFAPTVAEFGGSADVPAILEFIDQGGDLIVAGGTKVSEPVRELASECGVEFDDDDTNVLDHFNYDASDAGGAHNKIIANKFTKSKVILPTQKNAVLFKGTGMSIDDSSSLLTKVLVASDLAYSGNPAELLDEDVSNAGTDIALVVALQARNNARVLFAGSLDMFSDEYMTAEAQTTGGAASPAGNREFVIETSKWAFNERGVLRAKDVYHHLAGKTESQQIYTVNDQIDYSIHIEEWKEDRWVPYDADDVQMEFVMMDPKLRVNLVDTGKGLYSTSFAAPDVYGIYVFRIDYQRVGYSNLFFQTQVAVRPFRHDQFERFIDMAYPYYLSAFSMMGGFLLLSALFLFHREK
eukprot:GFYU01009377.1.p1 GENE.GFYU01009377.1~~GFYU01009377.1.p1  ORF type:complete len:485 (-),score=166.09 GFYU01009377.1:297-1583(-)